MSSIAVGRGLNKRLDQLEPHLCPVGCPTCHGWTGVVLVGEDGPHRPNQCLECGRVVPVTLEVHLEGIQLALL